MFKDSLDNTQVVVTGAAGFIGSHLVDRLLAGGCSVTGIDNLVRGRTEHLACAMTYSSFTFLEADLASSSQCLAALTAAHRQKPVSMVWHLAANSDIPAGVVDPNIDLRDTFLTTFHVLEALRELCIPDLAFASSSAIYGNRNDTLSEDSGPLLPISNYGGMKLASEASIAAAVEAYLRRAWIFRFPNVVGNRATHGVILDLLRKLLDTPARELDVLGDGRQQKPYMHVGELLDAMLFIVRHAKDRLNYFNIAAEDEGVTVKFIAETAVGIARPGTPIRYAGGEKGWVGDVPKFQYSTAKLSDLGWKPHLSSHDAVRRALNEVYDQLTTCNL